MRRPDPASSLERRLRARREVRRLAASGREVARGYVNHVGWLWHAPGDELLALLRQGYFEAREQAFAWLYLRPGDAVVDGGAHVGLYSVLAAQATRGRARVLSVEANPATADLLAANLDEHGVDGSLVRRAIWSGIGSVRFETEQPDRAAYARVAFGPTSGAAEVPSTTVDAVLAEHGVDRVALVKLDVEGSEPEALEGAAATLARGACSVWMIEFTEKNLAARGWSTVRLGELVRSHGLVPCELDEERLELRPLSTAAPIWFANVLAVRDVAAVNARLRAAPPRNREIALDVLARARACRRFEELEELERLRGLARISEDNAAWARRTEALLADSRASAEASERRARDAEAALQRRPRRAGEGPVELDVCLCTHDPRPEVLDLAIRSLARQTAGPGVFRVLVVDNASRPPLTDAVLAPLRAAGIEAALTREEKPGLVQARLHGIKRTRAPWMLFVDDDNELADDFVAEGLAFAASQRDVGAFGGKLLLPRSLKPPRWARPYLPYLGIKDEGDEVITGPADRWGPWEPAGAGFWIRRDQLEAFRARIEGDGRTFGLGRTGRDGLASCEDSLMAREGRTLGLVNAYNPRLRLRHHLDPARFRVRYLLRLMKGYGRSHALLEALLSPAAAGRFVRPAWCRGRRFLRFLASELNAGRKKWSLPFVMGKAVYCWTLRGEYARLERGER